jgi:methylglyoxal reductase
MEARKLGSSELEISPVVLGTWALGGWLWGGTDETLARSAITAALDAGVTCIDTAPVYGFGLSESLVGEAIKGRRDRVLLATKCGLVWDERKGTTPFFDTKQNDGTPMAVKRCLRKRSILEECDESLQRLGTDVIDLYQCHWPDPGTPFEDAADALTTLKDQGKIRAFGVSNFTVEGLEDVISLGAMPASNQPKYSLLSRDIERDALPFCHANNIGCLAYSPMEMGLLTGRIGMDHVFQGDDTRPSRPWFFPENRIHVLDALDQIHPVAEKYGITLAQLAVAWIHNQPGMTAAIVGARNPEQAQSNAHAGRITLSPEDIEFIRSVFEPLELDTPYDPATAKR